MPADRPALTPSETAGPTPTYRCQACPETFATADEANAHHDAYAGGALTGLHQSFLVAAPSPVSPSPAVGPTASATDQGWTRNPLPAVAGSTASTTELGTLRALAQAIVEADGATWANQSGFIAFGRARWEPILAMARAALTVPPPRKCDGWLNPRPGAHLIPCRLEYGHEGRCDFSAGPAATCEDSTEWCGVCVLCAERAMQEDHDRPETPR